MTESSATGAFGRNINARPLIAAILLFAGGALSLAMMILGAFFASNPDARADNGVGQALAVLILATGGIGFGLCHQYLTQWAVVRLQCPPTSHAGAVPSLRALWSFRRSMLSGDVRAAEAFYRRITGWQASGMRTPPRGAIWVSAGLGVAWGIGFVLLLFVLTPEDATGSLLALAITCLVLGAVSQTAFVAIDHHSRAWFAEFRRVASRPPD